MESEGISRVLASRWSKVLQLFVLRSMILVGGLLLLKHPLAWRQSKALFFWVLVLRPPCRTIPLGLFHKELQYGLVYCGSD